MKTAAKKQRDTRTTEQRRRERDANKLRDILSSEKKSDSTRKAVLFNALNALTHELNIVVNLSDPDHARLGYLACLEVGFTRGDEAKVAQASGDINAVLHGSPLATLKSILSRQMDNFVARDDQSTPEPLEDEQIESLVNSIVLDSGARSVQAFFALISEIQRDPKGDAAYVAKHRAFALYAEHNPRLIEAAARELRSRLLEEKKGR